jgi:chaperone modulatory protein CbpM
MTMQDIHSIEILGAQGSITLTQISSYTNVERARVIEMVDAGLLEPMGHAIEQWQFAHRDLRRLRTAERLMNDLGINLSSVALILDLIEERDELLARVALLQRMMSSD